MLASAAGNLEWGPYRNCAVFIATVVCSDVGGYVAGVLFGKHPMAPVISPKKSWEGFAGSAIAFRSSRGSARRSKLSTRCHGRPRGTTSAASPSGPR